jgi:UDP-N-acetylmuramoyl-L-alanyl-D-glutamate--2,6-diaminopimelate ligase
MAAQDDPTGLDVLSSLIDSDTSAISVGTATHDSRLVTPGSLYACLRGAAFDGHDFAADAVSAGAVALLVDHRLGADVAGDTTQILVDDTRLRLGPIAALLAGSPSRHLTTVGITGTNGKTTTAHLLAAIFETNAWQTGVIGTLHGPRTTPEAPELQAMLTGFVDGGSTAAVLEVSSHALALHRVDGTEFNAVVFTKLGHDHLDLHGTPEEYFRAKASLFVADFAPIGVINTDDPYGRLLADTAVSHAKGGDFRVVGYSSSDISDVEVMADHHKYRWRGAMIEVAIGGGFNVSNSLAALTTAVELGIDIDVAAEGLRSVEPVPGRFEVVRTVDSENSGFTVVVDYAHTPDGLAEVLDSARRVCEAGATVTIVFGCGGDRDREKRPEMGAVASRLADRVIVTSDNPRNEDPEAIIDDVMQGVDDAYRSCVMTNPDRRSAIAEAISEAKRGDVVVIAGKGHERTQDLGTSIVDFDDRVVARAVMEDVA